MKRLDQLGNYVQSNCKHDMTIFPSSGFKALFDEDDGGYGIRIDPLCAAGFVERPDPSQAGCCPGRRQL